MEVVDLLRFGNDGYELDVSRRDRFGFGPSPEDRFHTSLWESAPEFAPWHLDDMPFAERTVLLERRLAEVNARFEQDARDYEAIFERAAQAAQGGNYVKPMARLGLPGFLTQKEIGLAGRMYEESKHDYVNRIVKQIIEPNIARINRAFGQENNPKFPAYIVEYIMEYSQEQARILRQHKTMAKTGRFLGIPYDWNWASFQRVKARWWNRQDPRVFVPKVFGWGWSLNIYGLLRRLKLIAPSP